MSKTPEKKCPDCGHKFKNFKRIGHAQYDGDMPACPRCYSIAWEKGYDAWLKYKH